jgi:energy-coupling factor transporter ATP-binding protein EcfA2
VLELLLHEHGLAPAAPKPVPLVEADLPADAASDPEILFAIGECSNVNAIQSVEPLTFEPSGITLVYGETGAGKSSYTRALKRIAQAAHQEAVLPNVFAGVVGAPRAVIDADVGNGRTKHIVPLDRDQSLLKSTTVFDGACARVYLTKAKTLEFTPTPLRVFGRAATAQRRIRELLDERIAGLRSRRPNLDVFPAGTNVRNRLETLSTGTTERELRDLATLSPTDEELLANLKLELASAEAGVSKRQSRQRDRHRVALEELALALEKVEEALSPAEEKRLSASRERVKSAEHAVENARHAFANDSLPASGGEGWVAMWEAARTFVEAECGHIFPPTEVCPLCQQPLSVEARERLERFEAFVTGRVEQELDAARIELAGITRDIAAETARYQAMTSPARPVLADENSEVAGLVDEWLAAAEKRAAALFGADGDAPKLAPSPVGRLRDLAEAEKREAERARASVDPARQAEVRRTIAELDARQMLGERIDEIVGWLKTAVTAEILEGLRRHLDTTSLSTKQAELAKAVVTDELRRSVRKELEALGLGYLKVDVTCRTERGETVAKIGLAGAVQPVSSVLSDGEQRGCALAFFLAEALVSQSRGGIIFDDPVSSLDVERIEHIARRLVELAQKREQLVVFTHNLVFAWCLQAAAELGEVPFAVRPLARLGDRAGIVRSGRSWPGERLKERLGRLRSTLQELEALHRKGDVDRYEEGAKQFAGDVRETWERAIEEGLFKGVVMRFQRDVKALKIKEVEVTAAQTQEIYDGMTETSPYHHQASLAKPVPTPTPEDLKRFLERLDRFVTGLKGHPASSQGRQVAGPRSAA